MGNSGETCGPAECDEDPDQYLRRLSRFAIADVVTERNDGVGTAALLIVTPVWSSQGRPQWSMTVSSNAG